MRWRRFVTGLKLCKLLKVLMALAVIKLSLLGMVSMQFVVPTQGGGKAVVRVESVPAAHAQAGQQSMTVKSKEPKNEVVTPQALDRKELLRKKEELDRREAELKALETKLAQDMAVMEERRAQLARMLDEAKSVKDKKDRHLVDVFSNMKAKQAASVLETMDEAQAVKILSGMRGRQAGEILTFVNARKAAKLAEQLTSLQIPFK